MYTEEPDFYDDTITNLEWFLIKIKENRFALLEHDKTIYDSYRNKFTTPGQNRKIQNNKKIYLSYGINLDLPQKKCRKIDFHRFVWMFYNKIIPPKNHHIHHIDGNIWNNIYKNLELILESEHVRNHCNSNLDKIINDNKIYSQFRIPYFYNDDQKICKRCKRMLPIDHFKLITNNKTTAIWCIDCRNKRYKDLNTTYQFPPGVLNDYIVTDIRFKFNIMNWTFYNILKKYASEGLTKDTLKDILLGKTYTHLNIVHGVQNTAYRNSEYITAIEHNHIKSTKVQADFTVDELCMIYGRDKETIEEILKNLK